jgi:ATP-dependent Clp protease adaptor protein ClpS
MEDSVDFAVRKKEKLKEPQDFNVVLLNDNYTPMDFVVELLMLVFHKDEKAAERIMMDVHKTGRGSAGIYALDIAQTKMVQVHALAEQNGFPLRCVLEPT